MDHSTGHSCSASSRRSATQLENYGNTIFVGEPTASRGNAYGDSYRITLPNSGITVRVSTLWWQLSDPRDRRPWTAPEIATDLSFQDYRSNRDPALEAILSYQAAPPLAEQLEQALHQGGLRLAVEKHHAYKADPRHRYVDTEAGLNGLGYRLLAQRQLEQAVAVFQLNVGDYPHSWNVYDSLAEAYLKAGQPDLAIRNYERSLAIRYMARRATSWRRKRSTRRPKPR
jgi:tetratricopeptide (TPR) repeat protein